MASKLMGSFSFVHLSVLDDNNEVIHVHSHMPPEFNPQQSSAVEIEQLMMILVKVHRMLIGKHK